MLEPDIFRIILTALLALLFLATGGGKLAGAASSHAIRDSINVPAPQWRVIGVVEYAIVVVLIAGIWFVPLSIAGSLGVVAVMIGAILSRVRAGGPQRNAGVAADAVFLLLGLTATALGFLSL